MVAAVEKLLHAACIVLLFLGRQSVGGSKLPEPRGEALDQIGRRKQVWILGLNRTQRNGDAEVIDWYSHFRNLVCYLKTSLGHLQGSNEMPARLLIK